MIAQLDQLQVVSLFFMLGLLPLVVVMTTSFTKFSIVLTLLRSALGVQQTPSNLLIAGIALAATRRWRPHCLPTTAAIWRCRVPSSYIRRCALRSPNSC